MLLACRHGTTKQVVKSLALLRKNTFQQPFATVSRRLHVAAPESKDECLISDTNPKSFAVLGGGITGLSAAYFLTQKFPNANVTVYESKERLGGWVESEIVEIDGGKVLFEWGPRSLRPDLSGSGKITLRMLYDLGLAPEIVPTSRDHVAARNRFIYYPDHLVRMPAPYAQTGLLKNTFLNLRTMLTESIFKGVIGGILAEPTVRPRPQHMQDESVGDFVRRRFGPTIADNMLSALFHGIYAGDIYKLSARTLLPKLWYLETRDPEGSGVIPELLELIFKKEQVYPRSETRILTEGDSLRTYLEGDEADRDAFRTVGFGLHRQSVYTFVQGIEQLTQRLEKVLRQNPDVRIIERTSVKAMEKKSESGSVTVHAVDRDGKDVGREHDYLISTLNPVNIVSCQTGDSSSAIDDAVAVSDTATVMVVNLYYSSPDLTNPYRGFGYLIPQSIPMEQNPERALGVIFASETSGSRSPSIDESIPEKERESSEIGSVESLTARWRTNHQDTAPGTKVTVMMGGHWWADWERSDLPSPQSAIEMAKDVLARHMNITLEPLVARAKLQENAIPQYRVGHRKAMARVHNSLQWYRGKLRVAGPAWQGGVGVNDCIRKAWEVVDDIGVDDDLCSSGGWKTGIENYNKDEEWVTVGARTGRTSMADIRDNSDAQGTSRVL